MTKNKSENYVEPKNVDSLKGITSFNVPELLITDVLNSVNESVNKLLATDYSMRFNLLMEQVEFYNLTKKDFLNSIPYYVNYIASKNIFDPSELPKAISDLYKNLEDNYEENITKSDINNIYDNNIKRLKFLASELKNMISINSSVILNTSAKDKSYLERLSKFTESEIYKNTTYEEFKNDPLDYLDRIRTLHMFNALELASVIDDFIYMMIEKINNQKKESEK